MPGYRFCRSDDIPLLVAAHNACWVPHFGAEQAITAEDFKRGVRQLGLWSSSCVVAFDGDEPIGVLIAAKRDGEANFVHRLAVRPGHERRGHGRHLLTSLVDKAAILGPPRVVAEMPAEWTEVRGFFERSGFALEATYADFVLEPGGTAAADDSLASLVIAIGVDELLESGAFDRARPRAWSRMPATLRARAAELEGLAVATDRVEAYVLFHSRRDRSEREVLAIGAADGARALALLAPLVERVRAGGHRVRLPRIAEEEVSFATLAAMGFRREREYVGCVAVRPSA